MSGIKKDDVFAAADALTADGEHPSVARVREWLGTGSNATITKYLRDWREHVNPTQTARIPDLPGEVSELFSHAWGTAVSAAREIAIDELKEHRQQADRECEAAQEQVAKAEDLLATSERERALLSERLGHSEENCQAARENSRVLSHDLKAAQTALAEEREAARADIAQANSDARAARVERDQIKAKLESQCAELQKQLKDANARYEADMDQRLMELEKTRQSLTAAQKEHTRDREAVAQTQAALRESQTHAAALKERAVDAEQQAKQASKAIQEERQKLVQEARESKEDARAAREGERRIAGKLEDLVSALAASNDRVNGLIEQLSQRPAESAGTTPPQGSARDD